MAPGEVLLLTSCDDSAVWLVKQSPRKRRNQNPEVRNEAAELRLMGKPEHDVEGQMHVVGGEASTIRRLS